MHSLTIKTLIIIIKISSKMKPFKKTPIFIITITRALKVHVHYVALIRVAQLTVGDVSHLVKDVTRGWHSRPETRNNKLF